MDLIRAAWDLIVDASIPAIGAAGLMGGVFFLARNLILTRLRASVAHEFNEKLERLKSEMKAAELAFASELKQYEVRGLALQSGVLATMATRQASLDKRRLEAIDQLWAAYNQLQPARSAVTILSGFNFTELLKRSHEPGIQMMFEHLKSADLSLVTNTEAWRARPFVSEMAWALLEADRAIVGACVLGVQLVRLRAEADLVDMERVKRLVAAAIPEYLQALEQLGRNAFPTLVIAIEASLLKELSAMLVRKETELVDVEHIAEILKAAEAINLDTMNKAAVNAQAINKRGLVPTQDQWRQAAMLGGLDK